MNDKDDVIDAETLPATMDSARTLALIANETPEIILARAHKAAVALKDVVDHKVKPVKMNGETYLEFEDWQTLGNFYNLSAKVVSTTFVQYGPAQGFEAKAEVIDKLSGRVITAAESMCLNDEEKWSTRAKYEHQGNQRVKVGEVAVPLFQLRSMAQTRACAKALRNVLAWVVVLAGYKATPAEEMDGVFPANNKAPAPSTPPQRKSANAAPVIKEYSGKVAGKYAPKGKSKYFSYTLAEHNGVYFQTSDEAVMETLARHKSEGNSITLKVEETVNGEYTNRLITEIIVNAAEPAATGAEEEQAY